MTKGKSKIVKLAGTSYFRRIRVSSNRNRLVQFNKVPRVRIPLSPSDALHFWLPSEKLNQNHKAYHEVIYVTWHQFINETIHNHIDSPFVLDFLYKFKQERSKESRRKVEGTRNDFG